MMRVPQLVDEHIDFLRHVNVSYHRNGISTSNDTRVTATGIEKLDSSSVDSMYQSQVTITSLVQSYHVGEWTCRTSSKNPFILLQSTPDTFEIGKEDAHRKKALCTIT